MGKKGNPRNPMEIHGNCVMHDYLALANAKVVVIICRIYAVRVALKGVALHFFLHYNSKRDPVLKLLRTGERDPES